MTAIEEKVKRPVKLLNAIAKRHPQLWKQIDQLRANRDKVPHKWPAWCYLPMGGALGILDLDPLSKTTHPATVKQEACFVATMAGWRLAKDIYIYDETVFEELWSTPIEGKIPVEVLEKLPTFCAYIAFPKPRDVLSGECHGFFVHLNHDKKPMLHMALDFGPVDRISADHVGLAPYVIELHEGSDLLECITRMHEKMSATPGMLDRLSDRLSEKLKAMSQEERDKILAPSAYKAVVEPLVSLTVYLCSTSAEIRAQDPLRGLRSEAYSKKTKDGVRVFVPEQPRIWEVAYRIGATMRAAVAASAVGHSSDGGTHASPRPHMRRAHWHSFWTGPKAAVGKPAVPAREIVVKWIPPTPVNMEPGDDVIPVVHRVTR